MSTRPVYPFAAIVGQNELKLALLLNAVNPHIGGLLIRGPKGTGKSTSVRSLADILPEVTVVDGCRFNCSPNDPTNMCSDCLTKYRKDGSLQETRRPMRIVTLPIGATEDRVVGSLDIEQAIKLGVRALEPGILAEANQNVLYIDEVNLLPDHITDDILDSAASGWNIVEREAISIGHPARFVLVGTMNPEEGELRPQLMDRFALHVTVAEVLDERARVQIITNNLAFGEDPVGFTKSCENEQEGLKRKVIDARKLLKEVVVPEALLEVVARACIRLKIDGHRPDIVIVNSAKTLAALEGRKEVSVSDILGVAKMAIGFRTRREGFEEPATADEIMDTFEAVLKEKGLINARAA
jgi:Mg-chelatase subunit ChlI